jgi:hypothetical protein
MAEDKAAWDKELQQLRQALEGAGNGAMPPAAESICAALKADSDVNRKVYVLGRLEAAQAVRLCRAGHMPWWPAFAGHAFFGDLAGLRRVYEAAQEDPGQETEKPSPTNAYRWISQTYVIGGDASNKIDTGVLRQLFAWKADPNDDNGKWLEKSLRSYDTGALRVLVENGASLPTVFKVMAELQKEGGDAQIGRIQDALAKDPLYLKVDDQTLAEVKFIADPSGGATFRTLFNFKARRVSEIYEAGAGHGAVMNAVNFNDYDQEALECARDRLQRLGGHPAETVLTFAKPRLPNAQVPGPA